MSELFAQPGEVGLIYTDENGDYHLLALSVEQHRILQLFVSGLTKEQPSIKADNYKVTIQKQSAPKYGKRND